MGRALLQDEDATVDQLTDALKSDDADAHLKIASAEADFRRATVSVQIQLAQLANQDAASGRDALLQMETVAANDRANARQRQQVTNDRTNSYLAYIVTVGFLLTIILVSRPGAVNPNNGVLQTLLGILGTGWASIMAFYYGSSARPTPRRRLPASLPRVAAEEKG